MLIARICVNQKHLWWPLSECTIMAARIINWWHGNLELLFEAELKRKAPNCAVRRFSETCLSDSLPCQCCNWSRMHNFKSTWHSMVSGKRISFLSNEQKQPGVLVLLQGHCLSTCEACRFCMGFGISNVVQYVWDLPELGVTKDKFQATKIMMWRDNALQYYSWSVRRPVGFWMHMFGF